MNVIPLLGTPTLVMRWFLEAASIDGIVTSTDIVVSPEEADACLRAWVEGQTVASAIPGPEFWREAYRVLKPGAHVLVTANTPCMDVISMAIRLGGFQIRDGIAFVHDSDTDPSPGWGPIILARKPLEGTVADNVSRYGVGGLNIDATRILTTENLNGGAYSSGGRASLPGDARTGAAAGMFADGGGRLPGQFVAPPGRFPANLIHDGSPSVMEAFAAFGEKKSGIPGVRRKAHDTHSMSGRLAMTGEQETGYADSGSVSRFFFNVEQSGVNLIRYLIRMIIPPGGVLLDPFATDLMREAIAETDIQKAILISESE